MIRPARADDVEDQRRIESAAGERFRQVGMADIAAHEPMSTEELASYARAGRSWVTVGEDDRPSGYVVIDVIDGNAYVEQISVDPDHQGQGLARALLNAVERWADRQGLAAMTLTTFRDVPWNRPLYEHLGFIVLRDDELSPGLRALRAAEGNRGLDPATRVCMLKRVRRSA